MKHNVRSNGQIKKMNKAQKLVLDFAQKADAEGFQALAIVGKVGESPELCIVGTACGVGQLFASALNELSKQYLQLGNEEFEAFKAGLFVQENYSQAQLIKEFLDKLMSPFTQGKNN